MYILSFVANYTYMHVWFCSVTKSLSKDLSDNEKEFLSEVFGGCMRFSPLLKVLVDRYYASNVGLCLHSDSSLYHVISYLILLRLEEVGIPQLKRLLESQSTIKIYKFLKFILSHDNLHGWIKDELCKVYDEAFIHDHILLQLSNHEDQLERYIQQLESQVNLKLTTHHSTIPPTTIKPFNLTNPKPRLVPTPEKIPTIPPHKPVPKSMYVPPLESEKIALMRDTQKYRAKEKLEDANSSQFSCAYTEKSEKTKKVIQQIIQEREAKVEYEPIRPVPVPVTTKEAPSLKLNTTAILREGARIQKLEEEEERRLAGLEAGERDTADYFKWQGEVKEETAARRLAEQKKRHLEGQLSYEEAIIAKQTFIQETKDKVALMKEESEQFMREYFKRRDDERKEMRRLVEATMLGHQNVKEAKIKLQQMKQRLVQKMEKENQELLKKALEEEEAEMRRKVELIQQIKAMESIPVSRTKFVDLTETGGQGLLSEMSVVELRERLALLKIAKSEEQEKKKKGIAATKEAKEKLLQEAMTTINRHKEAQAVTDKIKNIKGKDSNKKNLSIATKDKELNDLQEKLELKRKERERLRQESADATRQKKNLALSNPSTPLSPLETLLRAAGST
ncbi:PREDICTED: cilia- and flagella-associated protein 99-like isoform X2 [Amphimedon queenslandica]|uniref:Cilia- and flagella-associated protein 99 n=1 Tax=Amphimedon queenslandica TaxID=400682 RepID=A0A1X7VRG8_AMPQE|nr:PREDICTED: cilia- and flagella-associated protein 99-like isoform X2 [Amphimedon queenslandica]|eukprot:XP_019859478.1 PREDICTED: cilia- and flagella-associated protein 99-like isoform X2 [Amphimedon queenslandica]